MESFLRGHPKRTDAIQTASVEICESKYDLLTLSVIDTPGLDFQSGHELRLERQVNGIVKYMETQFADTLSEVGLFSFLFCLSVNLCLWHFVMGSVLLTECIRATRNPKSFDRARETNTSICEFSFLPHFYA